MPNFAAWLGRNTSALDALPVATIQYRAAKAWDHINDKPTTVAFRTSTGTTLAAQIMRLEWDNNASLSTSAAGAAPTRKLVIFGVRDHAVEADTVVAEGYRFVYLDDLYRITDITYKHGAIEAHAESSG